MSDFTILSVCGRMGEAKFFEIGEKKTLKSVFSIAVNRYRRKKDSEDFDQRTVWIPCVAWGRIAEQIKKYGSRGSTIMAGGDFDVEEYKDSDGNDRKSQFLRLSSMKIFNDKNTETKSSTVVNTSDAGSNSDEIPFG